MRNLKVFLVAFGMCLMSLVTVLSESAAATSDFDTLRVGGSISIQDPTCYSGDSVDLSSNWFNVAVDYFDNHNQSTFATKLLTEGRNSETNYWFLYRTSSSGGETVTFVSVPQDWVDFATVGMSEDGFYVDDDYGNSGYALHYGSPYGGIDAMSFILYLNPSGCGVEAYNPGGYPGYGLDSYGGLVSEPNGHYLLYNSMIESMQVPTSFHYEVTRSLIFSNVPWSPPSGYAGEVPPGAEPPITYVAMGDSFSSGEGNPTFEPGTDTESNKCHRSFTAYPRQLQAQASLGPTAFVACSGATTHDVLIGKDGEPSQLNALSSETEIVTISVGGNDIKFKEFATACGLIVVDSCSQTSDEYQESWLIMTDDTRSDYLPDALAEVYEAIATELGTSNTNARVLVVGYPYVTSYQEWSDAPSVSSTNCPTLNGAEAFAAETLVDQLNAVISDTVDELADSRFEFIDPTDPLVSDFPDHTVCRSDNWFNRINLTLPEAYTFHPNADGVEEYTRILMDAL